jgi:hypothetical protein
MVVYQLKVMNFRSEQCCFKKKLYIYLQCTEWTFFLYLFGESSHKICHSI